MKNTSSNVNSKIISRLAYTREIKNIEIVSQQELSFESMLSNEHCNKYTQ